MKISPVLMALIILLMTFNVTANNEFVNAVGMQFIKIPAGHFVMGLQDREAALFEIPEAQENALLDELPAHDRNIKKSFYMSVTEVTQAQWYRVMENKPGAASLWNKKDWGQLPVSSVSWHMAARFIEELNKLDSNFVYRFATEVEWEYVARAGSHELRPMDEDRLNDYAWYIENSNDEVQPVASRKANAFGVHDMLGNVWEWVDDWYDKEAYKMKVSDKNSDSNFIGSKVRRGGSYHCPIHLIRPGYRSANKPDTRYEVLGFRVAAEIKK